MVNNQFPQKNVRKPSVAGTFYPENKDELNLKLNSFLKQVSAFSAEGKLKILFVPHAGIEYSGSVASFGFKQVEGNKYSKIIMLGVSHRERFNHAAVFAKGVWETPLGKVEIDEVLANKLIENSQEIIEDFSPHKNEHSLEIELIFLQKVLKKFKIVPILLGQTDDNLISVLAKKISETIDDQTLLLISSDFSHYPSYEIANKVDKETIKAILSGKKEILKQTLRTIESQHYPSLDTCACGESAIKVGLRVAEILKISNFKLIKYQNSGDVTGDKSRVVGYGAIGAWSKDESKTFGSLDENAQKEALKIARKTLENLLSGKSINLSLSISNTLQKPLGVFVTLRKHDKLRGCIGTFEPKEPLYKVIQEMVLAAATKDTRFPPVSADEVKDITIEISVMTPKQKITDWKKIKLGKHGVVVQKGFRSGTFLPQVAIETGWNLEEFLGQLCSQKADLPFDCYKDPSVNLYTFEAQVFEER